MSDMETALDTLRISQLKRGAMDSAELRRNAFNLGSAFGLTEQETETVIKKAEEENTIRMEAGSALSADDWTPWLDQRKSSGDIKWRYWERYNNLLLKRGFPLGVISTMDELTDRTLGLTEDPSKEGAWNRRGLVLGHVQSGKTANYVGLINKAADAGYRVIIVIAGIQEDLRRQTQSRIDEGFTGYDSGMEAAQGGPIGVGEDPVQVPKPFSYTSRRNDFKVSVGRQSIHELASITAPVVFVIKKNPSTLRHLTEWLKAHNTSSDGLIHDLPMLLIDDEADNASVNTSKDPTKATRINRQIREVVRLFAQSCYIGYTATPFANIFIDKDLETEDHGRDLFPEDFLVSLDPPNNYMGANTYFSEKEDEERRHLREIEDAEECIPLKHDKSFVSVELPPSLIEAIETFLIAVTIRSLRGDGQKHASMLINVSRFIDVQGNLKGLVRDILWSYVRDMSNYSGLPPSQALENTSMKSLHKTWHAEFSEGSEFTWEELQNELPRACVNVRSVAINGKSKDVLDYENYEGVGLKAIAVGGFSLSRGLTLEGLCVSYFRRNSIMYDTLLQMARWFGYRPGYEDLCRLWMEPETIGWFMHINEAVEELRSEVQRMERLRMSPREFGLKVRSHPDSLIVTARNKMRAGREVPHSIDLSGKLIETHKVTADKHVSRANLAVVDELVSDIEAFRVEDVEAYSADEGDHFFHQVPADRILQFLDSFEVHPELLLLQQEPARSYIRKGMHHELAKWDVVLCGLSRGNVSELPSGHKLVKQSRAGKLFERERWKGYSIGSKQRVSSRGVEKKGLTPDEAAEAERDKTSQNTPDKTYRSKRKRPLLMLHWIDLYERVKTEGKRRWVRGETLDSDAVAYGISFPESSRKQREVEYVVNQTWLETVFGGLDDQDEEMEEEDGSLEKY